MNIKSYSLFLVLCVHVHLYSTNHTPPPIHALLSTFIAHRSRTLFKLFNMVHNLPLYPHIKTTHGIRTLSNEELAFIKENLIMHNDRVFDTDGNQMPDYTVRFSLKNSLKIYPMSETDSLQNQFTS